MSAGFDLTQTDRLLSTTRAVRKRLDFARPVSREVILDCIRLSQQAPTASNGQIWRWMVVTDEGQRAEVARVYREIASGGIDAGRKAAGEEDAQTARVYDSAYYLIEHLHQVPVLVIPCALGRLPEKAPLVSQASFLGSILPAVWSFQLALRSRGLGSALTTLHLIREAEVARVLGIPDDVTQVALLPVAHTLGGDFKPASRPPPETITYFERWGS